MKWYDDELLMLLQVMSSRGSPPLQQADTCTCKTISLIAKFPACACTYTRRLSVYTTQESHTKPLWPKSFTDCSKCNDSMLQTFTDTVYSAQRLGYGKSQGRICYPRDSWVCTFITLTLFIVQNSVIRTPDQYDNMKELKAVLNECGCDMSPWVNNVLHLLDVFACFMISIYKGTNTLWDWIKHLVIDWADIYHYNIMCHSNRLYIWLMYSLSRQWLWTTQRFCKTDTDQGLTQQYTSGIKHDKNEENISTIMHAHTIRTFHRFLFLSYKGSYNDSLNSSIIKPKILLRRSFVYVRVI